MDLKKPKGFIFSGSFYEGVYPIVLGAQVFGILPLKDIRKYSNDGVKFKWFSVATLTCLAFITMDVTLITLHICYSGTLRITANSLNVNVFYSMGLLIYTSFLQLAKRWVVIIGWWTEKEQRFLKHPYLTTHPKKLKNKLLLTGITIAILGALEHGLCQVSGIYTYIQMGKNCNLTDYGFDNFMTRRFDFVYHYMPNRLAMILGQFISFYATVAWNFLDLFIILISNGIVARFEQLTRALKYHLKNNVADSQSMQRFRMDFIALCDLLEYVDKELGIFMLLSSVNNLFFVCKQLLYVFNPLRYLADYVYFWYSVLYLVGRTLYVFVSAAAINESARGPKPLLHNIPQEYWNDESDRFLFQINSTTIALSAMGFCHFTKGLILTMAGAMVTFQLVMLQFGDTVESLGPLCS